VVTASWDKAARIWDAESSAETRPSRPRWAVFSPDERRMATASNNSQGGRDDKLDPVTSSVGGVARPTPEVVVRACAATY
jgi:hypothetical protein